MWLIPPEGRPALGRHEPRRDANKRGTTERPSRRHVPGGKTGGWLLIARRRELRGIQRRRSARMDVPRYCVPARVREVGGMVQDLDIARWRLRSQHLVSPHAVCAREVVGSLLAVQAENPSQAAWAVAARTQNPDQGDLATLLDDGAVLRTHVLRPTWHFVRAETSAGCWT
jgi:hypothetical protein